MDVFVAFRCATLAANKFSPLNSARPDQFFFVLMVDFFPAMFNLTKRWLNLIERWFSLMKMVKYGSVTV